MKNSCAWDLAGLYTECHMASAHCSAAVQVLSIVPDMSYKEPLLLHEIG